MKDAVEYVREVVEEDGPYDAVLGFSQVRATIDQGSRLKQIQQAN